MWQMLPQTHYIAIEKQWNHLLIVNIKCIIHVVICFLMVWEKGLFFIHCRVCDDRLVTSAKSDEVILYLISLLSYLRKKFFIHFTFLVIFVSNDLVSNITYFVSNECLLTGLYNGYKTNVKNVYIYCITGGE